MPKVKISEFDVNPDNNTDINNINIAEGCAPSGINNAIRQLMSDLKEFQSGSGGDPFNGAVNGAVNGTVGATTPSTGSFTTLAASSTVSGAGFSNYLASPPAIGGTAPAAGAFTTVAASGNITMSGTGHIKLPVGTTAERTGSPANGMFRYNSTLASFEGYVDGAWGGVGGAQAGGVIYENGTTISSNYTLTTGKNGFSVGAITIASGVTVTVPSGQRWVVL